MKILVVAIWHDAKQQVPVARALFTILVEYY